jgi:hypothetical protein
MISFAGKGLVTVTAVDAYMVRFIIGFIQRDMKGKFVISNFD